MSNPQDDGYERCAVVGCDGPGRVHMTAPGTATVVVIVCGECSDKIAAPGTFHPGTFFDDAALRNNLDGWLLITKLGEGPQLFGPESGMLDLVSEYSRWALR